MAQILNKKPVLYELGAFDAYHIGNNGIEIKFSWNEFLSYGCQLNLYVEDDLIYSSEIYETMNLSYVISNENTALLNLLKQHQNLQSRIFVTITVFSQRKEYQSTESDKLRILLYDTPIVNIDDVTDDTVINAPFITASITEDTNYKQKQGIDIHTYRFVLYNKNKTTEIDSSPDLFLLKNNIVAADDCSYTFYLDNNVDYVIAVEGQLVGGMAFHTEYPIRCEYSRPAAYQGITLTNNINGTITVKTEVTPIKYESSPTRMYLEYIDGAVDLSEEGAYVSYSEGFLLDKDFVLHLKAKNIPYNKPIRIMQGDAGYADLIFVRNTIYEYEKTDSADNYAFLYDGDKWIKQSDTPKTDKVTPMLIINNGYCENIVAANAMEYASFSNKEQYFHVMISRHNYLYGLMIEKCKEV